MLINDVGAQQRRDARITDPRLHGGFEKRGPLQRVPQRKVQPMFTTNHGTTVTIMSKPEINLDRIEMMQDARDILSQVEDAIGEIDRAADQIHDLMVELCGLDGLPEDVEQLADNLRALDLTSDLSRQIKQLRSEIESAETQTAKGESSSATSP